VGFSYDVTGQQKTVVHAGFGLSYERVEGNYYINSVAQLPFVSVSNLLSGNADTIASAAPASANPTTIGYSRTRNLEPPRVKNWSMGVQQRLSSDTMAEVNYVGSSSANLTYYQNINQEAAGTRQAHPGVSVNALRPYLGYADIFQSANGGISNYNSLQARILKQMRHGGTVSVSYTWSKDLTDAFYYNYNPQDSTNNRADYGPADSGRQLRLSAAFLAERSGVVQARLRQVPSLRHHAVFIGTAHQCHRAIEHGHSGRRRDFRLAAPKPGGQLLHRSPHREAMDQPLGVCHSTCRNLRHL
jgi:hypothetical protein